MSVILVIPIIGEITSQDTFSLGVSIVYLVNTAGVIIGPIVANYIESIYNIELFMVHKLICVLVPASSIIFMIYLKLRL